MKSRSRLESNAAFVWDGIEKSPAAAALGRLRAKLLFTALEIRLYPNSIARLCLLLQFFPV